VWVQLRGLLNPTFRSIFLKTNIFPDSVFSTYSNNREFNQKLVKIECYRFLVQNFTINLF
jgi:hypothetical protein